MNYGSWWTVTGVLTLVMLSGISCTIRSPQNAKLNKDKIIEIANKKLEEKGYKLSEMKTLYEPSNKSWKEQFQYLKDIDSQILGRLEVLEGRDYQAVLYTPKEQMLGGIFWVFVDRKTGEIITWYGEG